jgi:hypothetical protein
MTAVLASLHTFRREHKYVDKQAAQHTMVDNPYYIDDLESSIERLTEGIEIDKFDYTQAM